MRRLPVSEARPGEVLARPVVNTRGVVVVQAGVALTEHLIERLGRMGVWYVFLEAPGFEGIEPEEPLTPAVLAPLADFLRNLASALQEAGLDAVPRLPAAELTRWSYDVADEVALLKKAFLLYYPEGRTDQWVARTVNMAVLAAHTLRRLGGVTQARHLVLSALLRQLALLRLPEGVREGVVRGEAAARRAHVEAAEALTGAMFGLSPVVKAIVLQHHERWDGSGQPHGRRGEAIHPLARVLAVVDDYLIQTFDREEPLLPHEALEHLMAGASFEYDHAAVKAFANAAPLYPVGTEIELGTGERAVVVGPSGVGSRPVVRILTDAAGRPVQPRQLNLAAAPTYVISKVIHA
ncbi:MAG: hypothetical protein GX161_00990 [Firmicutes bacterium]|nr:hypothetical protein [Bacillota bacterium]